MFPSFFLLTLLSLTGIAHAETDWSRIAPNSHVYTTLVMLTILAIILTALQFLHCLAALWAKDTQIRKQGLVILLPGLVSLLALYILRTYFLIHYNSTHFPRAFYTMLYFTEQFSTILVAVSTMVLLYYTEHDWYQDTIVILRVKQGIESLLVGAWLALVVAQTITYQQPSDVDHNPLLTVVLYQPKLTHIIIGLYTFISIDVALSSFMLWLHARKRLDLEEQNHVKTLLLITPLLAIRALILLALHFVPLISIPPTLVKTIWIFLFLGWILLDPALCYVALYTLLHSSQVPAPIRFRSFTWAPLAGCINGMTRSPRLYLVKESETRYAIQQRWE
ncbi:hypothetical protein C8F04DRAFT_1141225 [Mycena alexandri]|uniref:Uncharacterized protein n=1 Tax=Mycena alexandri TaxID=1745969 RepID=A0AAD6WRY6_9AGAR|nr:hypothetical protein C8F04DRAFT_1141225 [Mycena alexandri]